VPFTLVILFFATSLGVKKSLKSLRVDSTRLEIEVQETKRRVFEVTNPAQIGGRPIVIAVKLG